MTAYNGNSFLFKIGTSGTAGTTIANLRTASFQVNNEIIDITDKDSSGWRTILDAAGRKQVSITASGVLTDSTTIDAQFTRSINGSLGTYGLLFGDGDALDGVFKLTTLSGEGPVDDAQTWSVSLESSGAVTLTTA